MRKPLLAAEPDLHALLASWQIALTGSGKSAATVTTYLRGARLYLTWCTETDRAAVLTREQVREYIAVCVQEGKEGTTVRLRLASLRAYARWLTEEDELDADPLDGIRPPKLATKIVDPLTDDQIRALIKTCQSKSFRDRRDEGILRFMSETGVRAGELVAMAVADVDLARGMAVIRKGKGAKGRLVPFGAQTAMALDRYIRLRRSHKLADTGALWLGTKRGTFAYFGLNSTLRQRADEVGIKGFHLHQLRNTAATRWLAAGGSEGGLMAVAGWSNRSMLDRYVAATASERAAVEARGLNLGDL